MLYLCGNHVYHNWVIGLRFNQDFRNNTKLRFLRKTTKVIATFSFYRFYVTKQMISYVSVLQKGKFVFFSSGKIVINQIKIHARLISFDYIEYELNGMGGNFPNHVIGLNELEYNRNLSIIRNH